VQLLQAVSQQVQAFDALFQCEPSITKVAFLLGASPTRAKEAYIVSFDDAVTADKAPRRQSEPPPVSAPLNSSSASFEWRASTSAAADTLKQEEWQQQQSSKQAQDAGRRLVRCATSISPLLSLFELFLVSLVIIF